METNLYVFITHQDNLNNCYEKIKETAKTDFIIIQGGFIRDEYNEETKILNLNCNDKYVGLPEKIMKTFHFIVNDNRFDKYTHIVKVDDDIKILKKFGKLDCEYGGLVEYVEGNRRWHTGRTGTFWDQIPYMGEYVPWCLGGNGYIVSRDSLKKITPNFDYLNHIYEDVYLAIVMKKHGINPVNIDIKSHLSSPDH